MNKFNLKYILFKTLKINILKSKIATNVFFLEHIKNLKKIK